MLRVISDWFDYIFYRASLVYRFFNDSGTFSPSLVVSVIKSIILLDVFEIFILRYLDQKFVDDHSRTVNTIIVISFLIITAIDYKMYKKKFEVLNEKWKDESSQIRISKGLLVFITFIIPWVPLVIKSL